MALIFINKTGSHTSTVRVKGRYTNGLYWDHFEPPQTPRKLYRLHHDASPTPYEPSAGFRILSQSSLPDNIETYDPRSGQRCIDVDDFRNHCSRKPVDTPFISTTSDPKVILDRIDWALQNRQSGVFIAEIIPERSKNDMFLCEAQWLAYEIRETGITSGKNVIAHQLWHYLDNEWIVANEIPPETIVRKWSPEEFQNGESIDLIQILSFSKAGSLTIFDV